MSKTHSLLVVFLATGLFAGVTAVASQAPTEGGKATAKQRIETQASKKLGEAEELTGTLAAVDTTTGTVTVRAKETPYVFRLTKKTKITVNGSMSDVEALAKQVNQSITVKFVPRSDGNFAENVEVKS